MKILIVCSYKTYSPQTDFVAPFIYDQVKSLNRLNIETNFLFVKGGGIMAYLLAIRMIFQTIKKWNPDIIHAHGGLCGLISTIQRIKPVVTTYHGSDINVRLNRLLSRVAILSSKFNIFVSQKLIDIVQPKINFFLLPCGVDFEVFYPIEDQTGCKIKMKLDLNKQYVLFSKMFSDPVKNYPLAKEAVSKLENAELLEFIGYTREQACLLINACDAVVLTSFSEGSPQFIKEAMACNCPIVSVDVGDVKEVIEGTTVCYLAEYDANDIALKLKKVLNDNKRTNGREHVTDFDNELIAKKLIDIYKKLLN